MRAYWTIVVSVMAASCICMTHADKADSRDEQIVEGFIRDGKEAERLGKEIEKLKAADYSSLPPDVREVAEVGRKKLIHKYREDRYYYVRAWR